jgi:hypothetical protein
MPEPKRIDFEKGTFEGRSGKVYFVESSLSVARYAEFQIYEKEMAYGLTMKGLFDKLKALFDLQNKMKFAESVVLLNDLMRGVAKIQERQPAMVKICCLYMNLADEDRGIINQDMIDRKVEDWAEIDVRDFFTHAIRSVNGLIEIYATVSQAISDLASQGNEQ